MRATDNLYYNFARLMPKRYREFIDSQLMYGNYKIDSSFYLGSLNLLSVLVFLGVILYPWVFYDKFDARFAFIGLLAILLIHLASYLIIFFNVEERRKRVEEALPDLLYLASANLKAGMPPYQALKLSALKEFGPLKEEIDKAASKAYGTESFTDALLDINKRIKSETLERALRLYTTAIKSGGHMAPLLEGLANDISESKALKREFITSTKTYTIFIMFIVIFGAPLLMAISLRFVDVISGIKARTGGVEQFGLGLFVTEINITSDFLAKTSIFMLTATGILSSMLIGVVKEGKMKYGMKYAPFVCIATLSVFIIMRHAVRTFFV